MTSAPKREAARSLSGVPPRSFRRAFLRCSASLVKICRRPKQDDGAQLFAMLQLGQDPHGDACRPGEANELLDVAFSRAERASSLLSVYDKALELTKSIVDQSRDLPLVRGPLLSIPFLGRFAS